MILTETKTGLVVTEADYIEVANHVLLLQRNKRLRGVQMYATMQQVLAFVECLPQTCVAVGSGHYSNISFGAQNPRDHV